MSDFLSVIDTDQQKAFTQIQTMTLDPRLPRPVGYKLLCEVPKFDEQNDDARRAKALGIELVSETAKKEETATVVMRVVAMGPDAYKDTAKFQSPWCQVGDYVIVRSYSGTRLKLAETGTEYRFVFDDAVEGVVDDPTAIDRAF